MKSRMKPISSLPLAAVGVFLLNSTFITLGGCGPAACGTGTVVNPGNNTCEARSSACGPGTCWDGTQCVPCGGTSAPTLEPSSDTAPAATAPSSGSTDELAAQLIARNRRCRPFRPLQQRPTEPSIYTVTVTALASLFAR